MITYTLGSKIIVSLTAKVTFYNFNSQTRLINELESFFSNLFFIQIGTSALCICGSVYCVAFVNQLSFHVFAAVDLFYLQNISKGPVERVIHVISLIYNICDIFVITYFGNEIMLSSNRLSYSFFESNWIHQPQSTKKYVIIFCEYLKQPHELIIGKLYPLTLELFKRVRC